MKGKETQPRRKPLQEGNVQKLGRRDDESYLRKWKEPAHQEISHVGHKHFA